MLDYVQNTLLIRIPRISKENLADEWVQINRAQPVSLSTTYCPVERKLIWTSDKPHKNFTKTSYF